MPQDNIDLTAGLVSQKPDDDIDLSAGIVTPSSDLQKLRDFAAKRKLRLVGDSVSGAIPKTGHNTNSKHYTGQAIDVDYRGVDVPSLSQAATASGFKLRDERTRPKGQKVWGGP